ncbi:MAG: hypothetical protein ABI550_04340 [Ignavibacteriaceae bacterium]
MELKNKKRILVIGACGTGKSTFAKILSQKLKLDVIHLDKHFHKPNWVPKSQEEFTGIVKDLILKDEWIMEGNYSKTLYIRASRSDFIFFFDFPSYFCTYRILKRNIKTKLGFEKRDDMADGCYEQWVDWEFVKFTWNFKKNIIPLNYKALEELNYNKNNLIIFKSHVEVKKYLKMLEKIPL